MMVDNLGKNMMLDSWDGKIWYPRFYDMDTICSYNNSGEIKYDVDIEMAQGYWNTSASRLWTKIRDNFHDELVAMYAKMRANGLSYDSLMSYFYGQQISKIPETYYNKDADTKYLPFADQYMGMAHGNGYEHLKRWLKNRLIFTDTLYDYAPSYNNDVLTIRANTTEPMTITIETYTPVYQHLSWYNNQMDKKKIDGKIAVTFTGTAQTATDQEVLIYGGSNIKRITGISSMNPNSMLIGSATRLIELDVSNCPILATVNATGSNFTPHTYLNKLDISNCPNLTGTLRINNSPLLRELNAKGTGIDTLQLAPSLRNLEVLRLPNTVTELTLNDAGLLNTLEFDEGGNLQRISLSNCPGIANSNIDLTKVPTVSLDNSLDKEELYLSEVTDLTLKNMPTLKRVLFTPNNEYEEFDINNVINGKNYKVTTFNNPNMKEFITTAPHRLSYNNVGFVDKTVQKEEFRFINLTENYSPNGSSFVYTIDSIDLTTQSIRIKLNLSSCTNSNEDIISIGESIDHFGYTNLHVYYTRSTNSAQINYKGNVTEVTYTPTNDDVIIELNNNGFYIEDNLIFNSSSLTELLSLSSIQIGSKEGAGRSKAVYEYISYSKPVLVDCIIQVKDYGDIKPNTTFTANSLDLSNTQFTDIKFLCTTDLYNLKVPTTMKNFYCDSAMDIDTEVVTDGSYEVIHDELIEQYTTNYDRNVVLSRTGKFTKTLTFSSNHLTDYVEVIGGGKIYVESYVLTSTDSTSLKLYEYDVNKTQIKVTSDWAYSWTPSRIMTVDNNTKYVRFEYTRSDSNSSITVVYDGRIDKVPNIIPSSASGSLIFSMYAPSKTVEPAVNTWDLYGLELKDFYTYGMNNDVKPSEGSLVLVNKNKELTYCYGSANGNNPTKGSIYTDNGNLKTKVLGWLKIPKGNHTITTSNGKGVTPCWWSDTEGKMKTPGYAYGSGNSYNWNDSNVTTDYYECYLTIENTAEWVMIDNVRFNLDTIDNKGITGATSDIVIMSNLGDLVTYNEGCENVLYGTPTSITMPKRYEPYSIQIKNANITPNNYPTMLYPLLVNTTLPITGKLDYTKYKGTSLAWAYAYTTNDVTRLPLDSRHIGQITNDYNKLYSTDFVDIVDVWAYKDDDFTSKTTNENITKAYIELTSGNYKTRIDEVLQWYPNCHDIYLFEDGSVTSLPDMFYNGNNTNGTRTQVQNVTFMDENFNNLVNLNSSFRDMSNLLTCSNIPNAVTDMTNSFNACSKFISVSNIPSNVIRMGQAFAGCKSIESIPDIPNNGTKHLDGTFSGCSSLNQQFDFSNMTMQEAGSLGKTFQKCSSLTYPPILPSNYTGSMNDCFNGCSSLVEAPVLPEGVTAMRGTFDGCTSLTTIGNIPSNCNDYYHFAYECTSLTSVPTDGWHGFMHETFYNCTSLNQQINISPDATRTSLDYTFKGCTSLSITPTLPASANCSMTSCFQSCTSLVTPPVTPEGVTAMIACYAGCSSLTTAPNIPSSCADIKELCLNCSSMRGNFVFPLDTIIGSYNNSIGGTKISNITWTGNRSTNFVFTTLNCPSTVPETVINDLVPEHLADLSTPWKLNINNKVYTFDDKYSATDSRIFNTEPVLVGGRGTDEVTGTMKLYEVIINDITFIPILDTNGTPCMIRTDNDTCYYDTAGGTVVGGNSIGTYGDYTRLDYISFTDCYIKVSDITLDQSNHNITYLFRPIDSINAGFYIVNGVQCSNFNLNQYVGYIRVYCSAGFYLDLVDENGSPTVLRKSSAILTLGETYGAYLSPDEVFLANRKGWTIEGASNDFTIINASDDVSSLTTDENITSCVIELTSSNYTTRIDEVLQWYPNCHDVYLFDDGSVTNLYFMNSSGGNNNAHGTRTQIQNVTFVEGYFNNLVNLEGTFIYCDNLVTVNNIPKTVIALNSCFESCTKLNCQLDFSEFNIAKDKLQLVFVNNRELTYAPILPSNYTGSMQNCFNGCTSLVEAPVIPDGVTNMDNTFKGCTSLTTVSNVPSSCTSFQESFFGCSNLANIPTNGWKGYMLGTFRNCTSLNQQINISSATTLQNTFNGCSSLSITPTLPASANCTMESCFQSCSSLVTPPVTPDGVTNMASCYKWCGNLSSAPNIPESCNNIYLTFQDCSKFTSISIPLHITAYGEALSGCNSLTDITWTGLRTTDFSLLALYAPPFTQADVKELVNDHLGTVESATLTLGETYLAYLTEEEKASAVSKGWTLQ